MILRSLRPLSYLALKYQSKRILFERCVCLEPRQLLAQELRFKYTQNKGVKGIKSKKSFYDTKENAEADEPNLTENRELINLDDREYDEIASKAMYVSREASATQNVLIIQPYVKWGSKKNTQRTPDDQLQEAEALIRSLPNWNVALSLKVPLESLDRKVLFGSGKLEELKTIVQQLRQRMTTNQQPLTCLFVSKSSLSFAQKRFLETEFNLPVMDRYSVVIQILRLHATSTEARLQVAMAEIPYIWSQAKDANLSTTRRGYSLSDAQREILKTRERKLRNELDRVRAQRKLLRNRRKQKNYPIVAVVGYTNAGKTSLIKALTDEQTMQPRDQFFATLDVTAHAGVLPCNLEVIYMDTVGFMSDLPTGLFECFIATLEDAMLADVIVHVQDIAHSCHTAQKEHVETTLQFLAKNYIPSSDVSNKNILPPTINVGNKCDLLTSKSTTNDLSLYGMHLVSANHRTGLQDLLLDIETKVLMATGRRKVKIRVPNGGSEMSWLYKNAAVIDVAADESNVEMLILDVVITDIAMHQFKRSFCQ